MNQLIYMLLLATCSFHSTNAISQTEKIGNVTSPFPIQLGKSINEIGNIHQHQPRDSTLHSYDFLMNIGSILQADTINFRLGLQMTGFVGFSVDSSDYVSEVEYMILFDSTRIAQLNLLLDGNCIEEEIVKIFFPEIPSNCTFIHTAIHERLIFGRGTGYYSLSNISTTTNIIGFNCFRIRISNVANNAQSFLEYW